MTYNNVSILPLIKMCVNQNTSVFVKKTVIFKTPKVRKSILYGAAFE